MPHTIVSTHALEQAVQALEAELGHASAWHATAEGNVLRAGATIAVAAQQLDEATARVAEIREALDEMRALLAGEDPQQQPQDAAGATIGAEVDDWTLEDVPEGAEARGDVYAGAEITVGER